MKGFMIGFLALLLSLGIAGQVMAYGSADIPVIARIPQMIVLELDATELVFEESDFDYILGTAELTKVGVIATKERGVVATISGNVPYSLSISSLDEYLSGVDGGLIHISQLKWRLTEERDAKDWEALTIERVPVRGGPPGTLEVEFDFQFTAYWVDPAQVYRGAILLTVIPEEGSPL
ncbi:MAG: hypothetical protein GX971_13245 [Firmicutes bacterium]|nr:hypothetical protein [Bacillota bacterium]